YRHGFGLAVRDHRLPRRHLGIVRLLSRLRAADHARTAAAPARVGESARATSASAGRMNSGPKAKPVSFASGLAKSGISRVDAQARRDSGFAAVSRSRSHTAMKAPSTRS